MSAWWTHADAGLIGGIGGSVIGVLCGGVGAMAGVLAPRGKARTIVVGAFAMMMGVGVASAGFGGLALAMNQPYHVWYPLLLAGVVLLFVSPFVMFGVQKRYLQADQRRLEADLLRSGGAHDRRSSLASRPAFILGVALISALAFGLGASAIIKPFSNGKPEPEPEAAAPGAPGAPTESGSAVERITTLENGARVVLAPVEGVERVATLAVFDVGFLHDPRGAAQMAHLAEHLWITGATASHAVNEHLRLMNELGSANAETLPVFTYFDTAAPGQELPVILRAETERFRSLRIEAADIAREAPRCAAEVDAVASVGGAALLKFAFMAASQGWRHDLDRARVRTGLESFAARDVEAFVKQHYTPDRLTLYVAGDFEVEHVQQLARETLGEIAASSGRRPTPIEWIAQPRERRIGWDIQASAVILACPPPEDIVERIALTSFGNALMERAAAGVTGGMPDVMTSMTTWPVGELPFFIYAAPRAGESPEQCARRLGELLDEELRRGVDSRRLGQTRAALARLDHAPTESLVRQQTAALARMPGYTPERAEGAVLLQSLLNGHVMHALTGGDPGALERFAALDTEDVNAIVRRTLAPERRFFTFIEADSELLSGVVP